MQKRRSLLVLLFIGLTMAVSQRSGTAAEPYSCQCAYHKSSARGHAPCAKGETINYCEIVFSDIKLLDPDTASRVANALEYLSGMFSSPVPASLFNQPSLLMREVHPSNWGEGDIIESIRGELLAFAALPLLLTDTSEDDILATLGIIDKNLDLILSSAAIPGMEWIEAETLRVGSGCVEVRNGDVSVMVNSGWYVEHYEDGWNCSAE